MITIAHLISFNITLNFKNIHWETSKEFVSEIGLEPAMLLYLNGYSNRKQAPNENYARELYELFTLGEGNSCYQSNDITETARALTGYNKYSDGNGSAIIF